MAMSKDRVRFFLPARYFQTHYTSNGMRRDTCVNILDKAFGITAASAHSMMHEHSEGFHIMCRPSQFARFIVLRYDADECINGVKDLRPELVNGDIYDRISKTTGIHHSDVKRVLLAAGYSLAAPFKTDEFDVSGNFNTEKSYVYAS